jgi:hypothetical protein
MMARSKSSCLHYRQRAAAISQRDNQFSFFFFFSFLSLELKGLIKKKL